MTEPPDVLITDVHMPAIDGVALTVLMRQRWPRVPVLLMSGDPGVERQVLAAVGDGPCAFLGKPFDQQRLADVLARLVAHR